MIRNKVAFPSRSSDTFINKKVNGVEETVIITPSGQWWNSLSPSEQGEWKSKVREIGADPADYLHDMRRMQPRVPKGAR